MTASYILRGGLDLISPSIAIPPGRAIAAENYEPEARGYRRLSGYECFDGHPSPSAGISEPAIEARRALISPPPGVGPTRGVWIYQGAVYAFRDSALGEGQMFKSTPTGWEKQTLGYTIPFSAGTAEYTEGEPLSGDASNATAKIERLVLRSGAWDGTAQGYMVISGIVGTFESELGVSSSGSAMIGAPEAITLTAGGHYDFVNHNFYGSAFKPRMYFANGVGVAFEWNGSSLCPIRTGTSAPSSADDVITIETRSGDGVVTRAGDDVYLRSESDKPSHIGVFSNHLFLTYDAGALVHSGVGEPLDFRAIAGAGEISFGGTPTGLISSASTSLVIFGQTRVEYLTGHDSSDFSMLPISDAAGAARWSVQMAGEAPIYLDEAGLRKLSTTSAFGDWRMGSTSQLVEPLFRTKRETGATVVGSIKVKGKDQYRIFFSDRTGVVLYLGRKDPELMPIRLPITVACACSGEMREGESERLFVGSENGNVYEIDKGTSFDGGPVSAYVRLAWNSEGAPSMEKRFIKANIDTDGTSGMSIGVAYHVDYSASENLAGALMNYSVPAGASSLTPFADYASIDWTQADAGEIGAFLDGLGRNIALTLVSNHTFEPPHTLTSLTMFYSQRRLVR